MQTELPTKEKIIRTRKEIEKELEDLLKEFESDFSFADVKDVVYHEEDDDDFTKLVAIFDRGDPAELAGIYDLLHDAWAYLPRKSLGGLSFMEKALKEKEVKEK
jgi:hypothetical protein